MLDVTGGQSSARSEPHLSMGVLHGGKTNPESYRLHTGVLQRQRSAGKNQNLHGDVCQRLWPTASRFLRQSCQMLNPQPAWPDVRFRNVRYEFRICRCQSRLMQIEFLHLPQVSFHTICTKTCRSVFDRSLRNVCSGSHCRGPGLITDLMQSYSVPGGTVFYSS